MVTLLSRIQRRNDEGVIPPKPRVHKIKRGGEVDLRTQFRYLTPETAPVNGEGEVKIGEEVD